MAAKKKITEKELIKELEAYKKAKEENDERFMRERDEARAERDAATSKMNGVFAELDRKSKDLRAWEQDCKAVRAEKEALIKEADDAASRIVELQAMLQQKLSPAETCREERAAGNGGCGTCAICCKELKDALEKNSTQAHAAMDDMEMQWKDAKKEVFQFKADYEGACKLVADMHAAAVGEVRGPNVGPVEDVAAMRAELLAARKSLAEEKDAGGVLRDIQEERTRQDVKWGQQNHPDGTGHTHARAHADSAKSVCNHYAKIGQLTWMHILTEEMMEAFAETDPKLLRTELIQAAAVATAWAECIDRRQRGRES